MRNLLLFMITLILAPCTGLAEVYKDFRPNMTLKEIKNNYPNGKFEEVKAAWVTSDKGFYLLTGAGISGRIYLAFNNNKNFWKNELEVNQNAIAKLDSEEDAQKIQLLNDYISIVKKILEEPIENRLSLGAVRWVPIEDIPLERIEARYGKVEKCGYKDDDFSPYCEWISKGVSVILSDNKKLVKIIEYVFTEDDYKRENGEIIPENKQSTDQPKVNNESKKKKKI